MRLISGQSRQRRVATLALILVSALLLSGELSAREGNLELRIKALESRMPDADNLERLESRIQRLEAGGTSTPRGSAPSGIEIANQLDEIQRDQRTMRGQLEELRYELDQMKDAQKKLYLDMDERLKKLEARPVAQTAPADTGAGGSDGAAAGGDDGTPQPPSQQEQDDYLAAFDLLKQGQYDKAISAYEQFLDKYPRGEYADNAQYWLGEANYVSRNFEQSMAEFQRLIERYPQSDKVPGALLKVGYIHYERKDYNKARAVLQGLTANFPNSSAAGLAFERLERMDVEGV